MFPEYRELMKKLAQNDAHFSSLMQTHDELNHQIIQLEKDPVNLININDDIELLKRKKLKLKDSLYQILRTASLQQQA